LVNAEFSHSDRPPCRSTYPR